MLDREHVDSESEENREVFARFGLAMYFPQCLERQIATTLVTMYGPGPNSITGTVRDRMLEDLFREVQNF